MNTALLTACKSHATTLDRRALKLRSKTVRHIEFLIQDLSDVLEDLRTDKFHRHRDGLKIDINNLIGQAWAAREAADDAKKLVASFDTQSGS